MTMAHKGLLKYTLVALALLGNMEMKAQKNSIPYVYDKENTGIGTAQPRMDALAELPAIEKLPDALKWASRKGRVKRFKDWEQRRNEILSMLQYYEIGEKPMVSREQMKARMDGDTLIVDITNHGETLTIRATIKYPKDATGPVPAVIGVGFGSGSLPPDLFESRGIAMIAYNFTQVMSHTQKRGTEPYNRIYPDLQHVGSYSAWPWGVSRIIDALEMLGDECRIDTKHLAVTGCSFAGKMALFSGALDERIALTIAQEPGGGGAAAWRVSETLGNVETLGRTNYSWFMESMKAFELDNVKRLPIDHHELCALILPRALLVLGNPDYEWLADESGYVSCQAAREVWQHFGIADRMGFSFPDGHGHCQLPKEQRPEVEAFIDRFLLGKNVDTNVTKAPMFEKVDCKKWF